MFGAGGEGRGCAGGVLRAPDRESPQLLSYCGAHMYHVTLYEFYVPSVFRALLLVVYEPSYVRHPAAAAVHSTTACTLLHGQVELRLVASRG